MSNKRFGIKEVADVTFYKINNDNSKGEAVLILDTLKVSNIENTAEQSDAKGGKGNASLLSWDYGREITVTLQDAILSEKSMELAYGQPFVDDVLTISAKTFPGVYWVEGSTFARDLKTGKDEVFRFIIPRAKIQSENTLSMEAEGDPTVFDMNIKVLRNSGGEMMRLELVSEVVIIRSGKIGNCTWTVSEDNVVTIKDGTDTTDEREMVIAGGLSPSFEKAVIEAPVTIIDGGVFESCEVKEIHLPSTIEAIKHGAFLDCKAEKVYYDGSIEDWCLIDFENEASNPLFTGKAHLILQGEGVGQDLTIDYRIFDSQEDTIRQYSLYGISEVDYLNVYYAQFIESKAFANMKYLREARLIGVSEIAADAFSGSRPQGIFIYGAAPDSIPGAPWGAGEGTEVRWFEDLPK